MVLTSVIFSSFDTLWGFQFLSLCTVIDSYLCTVLFVVLLDGAVLQNSFFVDHLNFLKFSPRSSLELPSLCSLRVHYSHQNRCLLYIASGLYTELYYMIMKYFAFNFIYFWYNVCVSSQFYHERFCAYPPFNYAFID